MRIYKENDGVNSDDKIWIAMKIAGLHWSKENVSVLDWCSTVQVTDTRAIDRLVTLYRTQVIIFSQPKMIPLSLARPSEAQIHTSVIGVSRLIKRKNTHEMVSTSQLLYFNLPLDARPSICQELNHSCGSDYAVNQSHITPRQNHLAFRPN